MEESGSEGLDELVFSKKDTFLKVSCNVLSSRHLKNNVTNLNITKTFLF